MTETYPPEINGVALTVAQLVRGLCSLGHAVSVIRPRQRKSEAADGYADVSLVRGIPLPGYRGLQCGVLAARFVNRCWRRQRPHAVYVATEGPLGWSAVRTANRLDIPIVSGFHTNYHNYSRHYLVGWLEPLVFRYLRRFHNQTVCTVVPTVALKERLQNLGFHKVEVMGRGVDSQLFNPSRRCQELRHLWGVADHDVALLYVGRVAGEKNIALAVETYRAIKRVRPSTRFIVVGAGPLLQGIRSQYPELIFCGEKIGEQLAAHYASADIFLFPSETETFGNVTLEAMASGLAVLAYDYAAAQIHIKNWQTGVLAPYKDAPSFIKAGVILAADALTVSRIRTGAREYAATVDWQQVVKRFEALLTGAIGQNRNGSEAWRDRPRFTAIAQQEG